ncbi:hypothetical protein AALC25_00320 [Lachnospiraceae bacterium 29-84]
MEVTTVEFVKGENGEGYFIEETREVDFHKSKGRHDELCVVCGFSTYPECREWCPQKGYNA